jgi:hypothetical protein
LEEGAVVRSGSGAARTILLFHIISARPSKQPLMVRTFLKVYGAWRLFFVSARTKKRHHHLTIRLSLESGESLRHVVCYFEQCSSSSVYGEADRNVVMESPCTGASLDPPVMDSS